ADPTGALVARSTSLCRDDAHPRHFTSRAIDGGVAFSLPIKAASPCHTAHATLVSAGGPSATITVDVDEDAIVTGACETVCPAVVVVDAWLHLADQESLVITFGSTTTVTATRQQGHWQTDTADVAF